MDRRTEQSRLSDGRSDGSRRDIARQDAIAASAESCAQDRHSVPGVPDRRKHLPGILACVLILATASAIRICGALNEPWLDEILALVTARNVVSICDIFTKIHSEVNHHLYTAYLYLVNPQGNWLLCRLPSLAAGIGTVAIAGLIGRRRSTADAFFAMFLIGFSYVMVLYSSEMRGYALAVFFSYLSFYLLDSYLASKRCHTALFFSLSVVFGIISQLTFLSFYLAALIWSVFRLMKSRSSLRQFIVEILSIHAIPLIFLAAFYFVSVRGITGIGGTPSPSLIHSYGTALAWSMGAPSADFLRMLTCIAAVVVLYAGSQLLWREKSDSYVFFLGVILVFPNILIGLRGADEIYVRYYIISIAFLLLLCGYLLAALYRQGLRGKTICCSASSHVLMRSSTGTLCV